MSRRARNPLDVPLAFTDTYGADDPGTLVVSTDDPAVMRTLRTEQASIFDALDDADDECAAACPLPSEDRVLFCTHTTGHGPEHTDGEYEWTFPPQAAVGTAPPTARPVRVMAASDAPAIGRFKPDGPDGYRARTAPAAPLRDTRAEAIEDERAHLDAPEHAHDADCAKAAGWRECGAWCPANDPDGCTRCETPTDPLERFPGGLCLTCYTPIGDAKARTMTADRLARMWGAR